MKKNSLFYLLPLSLILLGITILSLFLLTLSHENQTFFGNTKINLQDTGSFGSYVGGFIGTIFSLAGFLLVYASLKEQKTAFQRERFESKFFELLSFHRENVFEIEYKKCDNNPHDEYIFKGKQVFKVIYDQFVQAFDEANLLIKSRGITKNSLDQVYEDSYSRAINDNFLVRERNIDLLELAKVNIVYLIVFFGLSVEGVTKIESMLKSKYKKEFYNPIIDFLKLKPIGYSKFHNEWKSNFEIFVRDNNAYNISFSYTQSKYFKYYGGHQFRLGQYFRHLFQTVSFVNSQRIFPFPEKYECIKLLRAQLSDYELIIFFFNSLSAIGSDWELKLNKAKNTRTFNNELITKYQILKNVPGDLIANTFDFKKYYPDIVYDSDENKIPKKIKYV